MSSQLSHSLAERAMLVSCEVHMWTCRRMDKKLSKDTAAQFGLGQEAGRYNKWLLIEDVNGNLAKEVRAVISAGNKAASVHRIQTLPWLNDGTRIVTAANYVDWGAAIREAQLDFDEKVNVLIERYPELKTRSQILMEQRKRGFYEERNYPSVKDLENKFSIRTKVFPLPVANDFRVDIGDEQIAVIRSNIERHYHETIATATQDILQRLNAVVKRVAHLGEPGSVVTKSLSGDIVEVCRLVSRLNLGDDPEIETFRKRIEQDLSFDPSEIREFPKLREDLAIRAASIYEDMKGFMGEENDDECYE